MNRYLTLFLLTAIPAMGVEFHEYQDTRIDPVITETAEGWSADGGDYGFQLDRDGQFLYTLDGKTLSLRFDSIRYSRDVEGTTREWVLVGESDANFTLASERTWTTALLGGAYEIKAEKGKVKHTLTFPDGWKAGLPDAAAALGEIKTSTGQVLTYPIEIGWVWAVEDMSLGANPDAYDEVKEWKGAGLLGTNGAEVARLLPNTINGQAIQTSWLWLGDGIGFIWAHCLLSDLPDGAFELDPSLLTLTYSEVLDTYVDSANPATNYESATQLYASGTKRALWKIDYAQPSGTIISASVGLYQTGGAAADTFRVWAYPTFSTGTTWSSGYTASATGGPWFDGDDTAGWHWVDCTLWASEVGDTTGSAGSPSDATTATWADTGTNMDADPRFIGEGTYNLPDGDILIAGGNARANISVWSPTAETLTNKASFTGNMVRPAIAGVGYEVYGFGGTVGAATSAYWKYDHRTGIKTHLGYLVAAFDGAVACALPQGSILVAQGYVATATSAAFIFSPTDLTIKYITACPEADWGSSMETAGDGMCYLYGGYDGDGKSFLKFNPTNNTWTTLPDGSVARSFHSCWKMPSGNLGFIGGDYTTESTSHQVYSVTSSAWLTWDALPLTYSECGAQITYSTSAGVLTGATTFLFGGYRGGVANKDIYAFQYGRGFAYSSRIRRSLEIRQDEGAGTGYFYSNDYGDSTKRPTLRILTASTGEPVVSATDFTSQSNSTTYDETARLTLQPASRPEAARHLNFGGYIGGQFNGEWLGKEAFGWDGFIGPNRYNSYGILSATFPTGTGWISVADTSGNTDVQWSFSSGGGGSSGGLTTDQAGQLEQVYDRMDDSMTNLESRTFAQIASVSTAIAAATGQIDGWITAARNHTLAHIMDASGEIRNVSDLVVIPANIAAGTLRKDLIQWNQLGIIPTVSSATRAVMLKGVSATPSSASFTVVVNRADTSDPVAPPILGYNNAQASGISYATSVRGELGGTNNLEYHFLYCNVPDNYQAGLYQASIVQMDEAGTFYHSRATLSFVQEATPEVDTSELATLVELEEMEAHLVRTVTGFATLNAQKGVAVIASATREKDDPTIWGNPYDLHFIPGNIVLVQTWFEEEGVLQTAIKAYDYFNNTNAVAAWPINITQTTISEAITDFGLAGLVDKVTAEWE